MKIFDNPVALIVILIVVMMIFGIGKLPAIGADVGKTIRGFKDGMASDTKPDTKNTK